MAILIISNDCSNELQCPKCGYNLENMEIFNNLIKYNKNINNSLNELKSQIELININEPDKIEKKKKIITYILN